MKNRIITTLQNMLMRGCSNRSRSSEGNSSLKQEATLVVRDKNLAISGDFLGAWNYNMKKSEYQVTSRIHRLRRTLYVVTTKHFVMNTMSGDKIALLSFQIRDREPFSSEVDIEQFVDQTVLIDKYVFSAGKKCWDLDKTYKWMHKKEE